MTEYFNINHFFPPSYFAKRFYLCNIAMPKPSFLPSQHAKSRPHELRHKTASGIKVRSKSEVIIADALFYNKVSFAYEQPLVVNNTTYCPDFTIIKPNGQAFYWEHCGMLHDKEYKDKWDRKAAVFKDNGISVENGNLIVTEDGKKGINSMHINHLIQINFL